MLAFEDEVKEAIDWPIEYIKLSGENSRLKEQNKKLTDQVINLRDDIEQAGTSHFLTAYDKQYIKVCQNIKDEMKKRYITGGELAKALNITPCHFSNKLNPDKRSKFNIFELQTLAGEFLISIEDLLK